MEMRFDDLHLEDLIDQIKRKNVILFVGGGVSKNLGLPDWSELIDEIARQLGYKDTKEFTKLGSYLTLAEYYKLRKGSIEDLCVWMDNNWHKPSKKVGDSEIHKLIVNMGFPIIYTTNFDRWLERAFEFHNKPYVKVSNVKDFVSLKEGVTQIVKFHGDFDDYNSIVLTESSYFERMNFETPLDIKLRADVLGKTVLFIGYSFSDINVRYLMYRLKKQWDCSMYPYQRPKSYILIKASKVQHEILKKMGVYPMTLECESPGLALLTFLKELYDKSR